MSALPQTVHEYVAANRDTLIGFVRELVRIPSENMPPRGSESRCQEYVASALRECGWNPELYMLDEVAGLRDHELFWPGRDYTDRPNLGARRKGSGGGRSLVLSGHVDTVPAGAQPWSRDPFGGEVEGNRLYGRGSNDMKGGVATNLFVVRALADLDIRLAGDVVFESVVDEEFGGVNGTIAGRLAGFNADAAVISEPSFLRVCPAQRAGRIAHITLTEGAAGVLGGFTGGAINPLTRLLEKLPEFSAKRRASAPNHPLYASLADRVPVSVMKVTTGPWGSSEPMTIPSECRVELYWQGMPGEKLEQIDREFFEWLDAAGIERSAVEFPIRWLPGSAISASEPLVQELRSCAQTVLGTDPPIEGIEAPCDMFAFHHFGIPAVLWGGRGGNTHNPDEYVEIDSLLSAAETLLLFVCRWCGVEN